MDISTQSTEYGYYANTILKDEKVFDEASSNYIHPLYLQEPFHVKHLITDQESIEKLNGVNGDKWLSASLINFFNQTWNSFSETRRFFW